MPQPRLLTFTNGLRAWRQADGFWMVYTDRVFGYFVPNYLLTVTRDKNEVRRLANMSTRGRKP